MSNVHVIKFPSGRWGFVGTLPVRLGNVVKATARDVMAGRTWKDADGEMVTVTFPSFATEDEARGHALNCGIVAK